MELTHQEVVKSRTFVTVLNNLSVGLCGYITTSTRPLLTQFTFQVEISFYSVERYEMTTSNTSPTSVKIEFALHLLIFLLSPLLIINLWLYFYFHQTPLLTIQADEILFLVSLNCAPNCVCCVFYYRGSDPRPFASYRNG